MPGQTFGFMGYEIPADLAELTGGGEETWAGISAAHLDAYARYAPIRPGHHVLEIGCGVGRDAIPLCPLIGPGGRYVGTDVIAESIGWCQDHISIRHPNATFVHLDVHSPMYNPRGSIAVTEVRLPVGAGSVDRVIMQSVFTHMLPEAVAHYLDELARVLKPGGTVFASFFVLAPSSLELARSTPGRMEFRIDRGGGCWVCDPSNPEGAVGYTPEALSRLLHGHGLVLDQPVHLGSWCGRDEVPDGQDIVVLRRASWARRARQRLARRSPPLA